MDRVEQIAAEVVEIGIKAGIEAERAAVVAWLRKQAFCGCGRTDCIADNYPNGYADAIERGNHLQGNG